MRSEIRTRTKRLFGADSREEAQPALAELYRILDRASRRGVIKMNTAARQKSKAARHVEGLA